MVKNHKKHDIFHLLRNVFTSGYLDVIQIEQNRMGSRKWAFFRTILEAAFLSLITCVFSPLQVLDLCTTAICSNKDEQVLHFKNVITLTFTPSRLFFFPRIVMKVSSQHLTTVTLCKIFCR